MNNERLSGHITAIFTILVWGTTFISTKILLRDYAPVEILFLRFLIGLAALYIAHPRLLKWTSWRQELTFAAAGLTGICLYYLLENIALTYTATANVSVIVSTAPFFTAILSHFFLKEEENLGLSFFAGFGIAIVGLSMISFSGTELAFNPVGDLLSLLAAVIWAFYSIFIRKMGDYGYPTVVTTRRTFLYGIFFMSFLLPFSGFSPNLGAIAKPENLFNLLFLGVGASALCFATWNYAVKILGAVRTSSYIYLIPVITLVFSALILKEKTGPLTVAGIFLTLAGLFLSERKKKGPSS